MLQFDGGQAQCANAYPNFSTENPLVGGLPAAVLGPTQQGTGVLLSIFNNLADVILAYRDPQAGGAIAYKEHQPIQGLFPGSYIFPSAIGFRAKNHNAGQIAQIIAQVWETVDGPLPSTPLSPNTGTLLPGGTIVPPVIALGFEHNDVLVATEASIDFEDGGGITWVLTDDPPNGRVKVAAAVAPGGAPGQFNVIANNYNYSTVVVAHHVAAGLGAAGAQLAVDSTGKAIVAAAGQLTVSGGDQADLQLYYGVTPAPTQGANIDTFAGAAICSVDFAFPSAGLYSFSLPAAVGGLTLGSTYWFDVGFKTGSAVGAEINNVGVGGIES